MHTSDETTANGWSIKKEISLGDLIAFAMAFISVVYAYSTLDKRITIVESRQATQREVDQRQDEDGARNVVRNDAQFATINGKLDRLIERRP